MYYTYIAQDVFIWQVTAVKSELSQFNSISSLQSCEKLKLKTWLRNIFSLHMGFWYEAGFQDLKAR
jgi:hypothetical protein